MAHLHTLTINCRRLVREAVRELREGMLDDVTTAAEMAVELGPDPDAQDDLLDALRAATEDRLAAFRKRLTGEIDA